MQQLQLPLLSEPEMQAIDTAKVFEDHDEMQRRAPALFALQAHPKMSEKYAFTNTYDILLHIHNKGFKVTSVMGGSKKFNKFMVRMRHKDLDLRDRAPEIIIIDSHDGTSRIKLVLGMIEFICMNGMVAGDLLYSKSFVHRVPDLMAQIMLEVDDIQTPIDNMLKRVERMQNYQTNVGERMLLADAATRVRFGDDRPAGFIADMRRRLLEVRRAADNDNNLYTVMNVIQENILRGGMHYQSGNRLLRMAPINNVGRNIDINQRLWQEAERLVA